MWSAAIGRGGDASGHGRAWLRALGVVVETQGHCPSARGRAGTLRRRLPAAFMTVRRAAGSAGRGARGSPDPPQRHGEMDHPPIHGEGGPLHLDGELLGPRIERQRHDPGDWWLRHGNADADGDRGDGPEPQVHRACLRGGRGDGDGGGAAHGASRPEASVSQRVMVVAMPESVFEFPAGASQAARQAVERPGFVQRVASGTETRAPHQ